VAEPEIPAGPVISAPMVGIFHLIDGIAMPGATVKKGQAVGVIESMKLMNEVVAQEDGQIAEVYVEDGMPVEYGQTLFRLEQA
jgi:acetyl-CoA carboxylase biotin carboxyl carrier protein